jgi:hypothetical protein
VQGLVRSAQSENPGRLVLADLPASGDAAMLAAALLAAALGSGEPEVAVRDGQVYGRRLVRPPAGPDKPDRPDGPGARPGPRVPGTVLVTGGTGWLGGLVAGHLAATGRRAPPRWRPGWPRAGPGRRSWRVTRGTGRSWPRCWGGCRRRPRCRVWCMRREWWMTG